jgi:hypothetical protein
MKPNKESLLALRPLELAAYLQSRGTTGAYLPQEFFGGHLCPRQSDSPPPVQNAALSERCPEHRDNFRACPVGFGFPVGLPVAGTA